MAVLPRAALRVEPGLSPIHPGPAAGQYGKAWGRSARPPKGAVVAAPYPPQPSRVSGTTRHARQPPTPPRPAFPRVTDAERERVVERLKTAFVEGRLDQREFSLRVQQALVARTQPELAPLLTDLEEPSAAPVYRVPTYPSTAYRPAVYRPTAGERGWAMLGHVLGLATSFAGPLVILLTKGRESPFVRRQSAEAVNFQLTFLLVHVLAIIGAAVTLGLGGILYAVAFAPLMLVWMIFMLAGGAASLLGNEFRYPINIRLVR
ncbi:MAG: DUF4870 domain-containing protein [Streptosporangiales bacterium]|nr:DUF4870 domain-containing protein [Streptosporangiales bacterium]